MSNLTISIDDEIIKKARVRAIQQGTSLSAKVREYLRHYITESEDSLLKQRADATARLISAMEAATSNAQATAAVRSASTGPRRSLREEMYEGDFRAGARVPARSGHAAKDGKPAKAKSAAKAAS